ncbi:unnamed protein product [Malus baccata var. baccata]
MKAMEDEFQALQSTGTWDLVPFHPSLNLVGFKWVFRLKHKPDGSIEQYKARLVAKGFHQQEGLDFSETFNPVAEPTTIIILLSIVVSYDWFVHQLDVSNVFLHGTLKDDVYMVQPPGFVDQSKPQHVCKLNRSNTVCQSIIAQLQTMFPVKDLSDIHYFMGIEAVKRILRYLKGTIDSSLWFTKGLQYLTAWFDADWAGCPVDRRSTSGYCVFLGLNLISWSAKKQCTVAQLSIEAEYRSLANTATELNWVCKVLQDIFFHILKTLAIFCDNKSAIALAFNPVFHARTKHVEIDYHYIREKVLCGKVSVHHVASLFQLANIFTKSLPSDLFAELTSMLSVSSPHFSLRGCVRNIIGPSTSSVCD